MGDLGFFGIMIPEEFGGMGFGTAAYSASKAALPASTSRPATSAPAPRPPNDSNDEGSASSTPRPSAAATIAAPRGCSLTRSSDPA